jgi:dGTPase
MVKLRDFLYARVYDIGRVHGDFIKARKVIRELYEILLIQPGQMTTQGDAVTGEQDITPEKVIDFIAGMTDRYALSLYEKIFLPKPWAVL